MTWSIMATPTSCDRPRPWEITSSLAYTQIVRSITHHSPSSTCSAPSMPPFSGWITRTVEGFLFIPSWCSDAWLNWTRCVREAIWSGTRHQLWLTLRRDFVKVMHWVSDCASPSCDTPGHSDILVAQSDDIVRYQQILLWLQNISLANVTPSPFSCLSQCHAN